MITIYCLKNKEGEIVYVGSTNNLKRRLYEHREKRGGKGLLSRYGILYSTHEELEKVESKALALIIESAYFDFYKSIGLPINGQISGAKKSSALKEVISSRLTGRPCGEGTRIKLRENHPHTKKIIDQYACIYESVNDCARKTKLSIGNISQVLNGKRSHTGGLKLRRVYV